MKKEREKLERKRKKKKRKKEIRKRSLVTLVYFFASKVKRNFHVVPEEV